MGRPDPDFWTQRKTDLREAREGRREDRRMPWQLVGILISCAAATGVASCSNHPAVTFAAMAVALGGILLTYKISYRILPVYPQGCCVECGYDLTATPNRCPECGLRP